MPGLEILFAATAFLFQLVLIVHFALRKWRLLPRSAMGRSFTCSADGGRGGDGAFQTASRDTDRRCRRYGLATPLGRYRVHVDRVECYRGKPVPILCPYPDGAGALGLGPYLHQRRDASLAERRNWRGTSQPGISHCQPV